MIDICKEVNQLILKGLDAGKTEQCVIEQILLPLIETFGIEKVTEGLSTAYEES